MSTSYVLYPVSLQSTFARGIKNPDEWYVERLFQEILQENKAVYYNYRKLLTTNQWNLLNGIAKEKGAKKVMSGEFIKLYDLGSASSIQTALLALQEKKWYLKKMDYGMYMMCF
ncbi:MAG: hypothetical protein IPK10_03285 [Bacteroidetes bacterium]|nr:hypothetical protein [Bacteroidota bacterium]